MYDYKFHPEAQTELKKLNKSVQILFTKALKKILTSPELGIDLGNKNNIDLSGLKKMYFDHKRYRIVYQILEDEIVIHLIAIGKRDKMEVYEQTGERVEK
jgi:mRNA interferase RelE/StbE